MGHILAGPSRGVKKRAAGARYFVLSCRSRNSSGSAAGAPAILGSTCRPCYSYGQDFVSQAKLQCLKGYVLLFSFEELVQRKQSTDIKVFISSRNSSCGECGKDLGRRAWITLAGDKGALCLTCADLDHLIFLPSGDTALTRRARKHSTLAAVVLKWSRARKRYERQGLLVEAKGLEQAERECLADSEARARQREREARRRAQLYGEYVERFALRVRELFPQCPPQKEVAIAEHACLKYSGRIGRSAAAKSFDEKAIRLATIAHIRHAETQYDHLLARGHERWESRAQVQGEIDWVLAQWKAQK